MDALRTEVWLWLFALSGNKFVSDLLQENSSPFGFNF